MEYDRTLRVQGDYRAFMFQQARRWEVVPLERLGGTPSEVEEVRSGCTVLYRLRYVRDILLHPKIDDPGITAIGSMISFSSAELCTQVRRQICGTWVWQVGANTMSACRVLICRCCKTRHTWRGC